MTLTCNSCHSRVANVPETTIFQCPQCQNYEIVRCGSCRKNASTYTCPACSFEGPN